MALIPGLPGFPFLVLSAGLTAIGWTLLSRKRAEEERKAKEAEQEKIRPKVDKLEQLLPVDTLELEVGYGLINIVDAEQKGDLLERISNIRKQFALDLGVIVPPLRIRDNLELKPGDYQVLLKGIIVGQGSLMVHHMLAIDPGNVTRRVAGVPTKEPAFGLDALWITEKQKEDAIMGGYTVVDLSTVIATHLTEVIRRYAHEMLGRQELQTLLDHLKTAAPKVVDDLIPGILPVGTVLKVCKNLLREGVGIRDLRTILESLAENGMTHKDPQVLTEHVRQALARTIVKKLLTPSGELMLLTLEKRIEETIAQGIIQTDQGVQLSVDPEFVRAFVSDLNERAREVAAVASQTVVLCSPLIRPHLKALVDRFIPNIIVLSHNEIAPDISVRSFDTVRLSHAS
jgi:flagellar biosynthesis protein FlhA